MAIFIVPESIRAGGFRSKLDSAGERKDSVMRIGLGGALFAVTLTAGYAAAAVIGASTPAEGITAERISALPRAEQEPWRSYLDRSVRQEEKDRAFLQGELKSAGLTAALVPPSGNSAKSLPLNKAAEWYASAEARGVADIVVSFQTPAGGWSKNLDLTNHARRKGEGFAPNNLSAHLGPGDFDTPRDPQWNYVGTLDNDATTTELQFLARVVAGDKSAGGKDTGVYLPAILRGVEYLLTAQFPNGGWPQVWPLEGGYHDAITFNDGAITETLELLQDVADGRGGFAFVSPDLRKRAFVSVTNGIGIIIRTQIRATNKSGRTVWAQQFDALNLKPVAGRNYEPAAQCASESAAMILFLMSLPHPTPGIVDPVYSAVDWFRKTAIRDVAFERGADGRRLTPAPGAGPIWARYYEIGTDRPVFGDRDKSIHDDVNEISLERRNGYSWYNAAPKAALDRFAEWSAEHPRPKDKL
jgi:PelA/Pel-15E family pectate lyase